jgi:hypothetical protein
MLDYAANGVRYWPVAQLQTAYEQTQAELGRDPVGELRGLCDDPEITQEESSYQQEGEEALSMSTCLPYLSTPAVPALR